MIGIEVVESRIILSDILSPYRENQDSKAVIRAEYDDIMSTLLEDKRTKWYTIKYRGRIENIVRDFSLIKPNSYQNYFLHGVLHEAKISEVTEIFNYLQEIDPDMDPEGVWHFTSDERVGEGEVDLLLILPEFEIGWEINNIMKGKR